MERGVGHPLSYPHNFEKFFKPARDSCKNLWRPRRVATLEGSRGISSHGTDDDTYLASRSDA